MRASKVIQVAIVATSFLASGALSASAGAQAECPGREGEPGNHIIGTSGDDVMVGTDGPDIICGFGGDDTLDGKAGDDFLYGGAGADRYFPSMGQDAIDDSKGWDTLDLRGTPGPTSIVLNDRFSVGEAGGEGFGRTWLAGIDQVFGSPKRDEIYGNNLFNYFAGNGGPDVIFGAGGEDQIYGGPGNDELHGGAGNDAIIGGNGADKLFGDGGNDFINASSDNTKDKVNGGAQRKRGGDNCYVNPVDVVRGCEDVSSYR